MADKVYVVIDGYINHLDYDRGDGHSIVCICDSFESACNYIRTSLFDSSILEQKSYERMCERRQISAQHISKPMTFYEYWRGCGYRFDPRDLPKNDDLKEVFTYQYDTDGCESYFKILEKDLEHYD